MSRKNVTEAETVKVQKETKWFEPLMFSFYDTKEEAEKAYESYLSDDAYPDIFIPAGFEHRHGIFECDAELAETIQIFNRKGWKTQFCCAGHRGEIPSNPESGSGTYIAFVEPTFNEFCQYYLTKDPENWKLEDHELIVKYIEAMDIYTAFYRKTRRRMKYDNHPDFDVEFDKIEIKNNVLPYIVILPRMIIQTSLQYDYDSFDREEYNGLHEDSILSVRQMAEDIVDLTTAMKNPTAKLYKGRKRR